MTLKGKSFEKLVSQQYRTSAEELLTEWYWEKSMTQKEIAATLNVSTACICLNFKKYNIKKKAKGWWMEGFKHTEETKQKLKEINTGRFVSEETREKMSRSRKGFKLAGNYESFSGKKHRTDGYIQVYKPEHPHCNSEGYIMEHRLIMEEKIGRYLELEEEVHHINHIRNDNRPENLHLFASKKDHMKFHMLERHGNKEELKYEYQ